MLVQTLIALFALSSCQEAADASDREQRRRNLKGEYLYRTAQEKTAIPPMEKVVRANYAWEEQSVGNLPKVTKEFFRCKGSSLNPVKTELVRGEVVNYFDCGGAQKHSLPLSENKEFIYPILIDLLNHIQLKTGKRVWITSGHRCPEHNTYADPSPSNQYSKHMIGAEVAFYVLGMENEPGLILKMLMDYYKENPKYQNIKDFQEFKRYEKPDANVSTPPWYNKEVFLKLYTSKEGRDFDNRHPYPYIAIQVRYDMEKKKKVTYTWDQAFRNFHRK